MPDNLSESEMPRLITESQSAETWAMRTFQSILALYVNGVPVAIYCLTILHHLLMETKNTMYLMVSKEPPDFDST